MFTVRSYSACGLCLPRSLLCPPVTNELRTALSEAGSCHFISQPTEYRLPEWALGSVVTVGQEEGRSVLALIFWLREPVLAHDQFPVTSSGSMS